VSASSGVRKSEREYGRSGSSGGSEGLSGGPADSSTGDIMARDDERLMGPDEVVLDTGDGGCMNGRDTVT